VLKKREVYDGNKSLKGKNKWMGWCVGNVWGCLDMIGLQIYRFILMLSAGI